MDYILFNTVKHKTGIRGFWLSDNGKLYKDNISLLYLNNDNIEDVKLDLFNRGELSVFYKIGDNAIIEDSQGTRQYLNTKTLLKHKYIKPSLFKALLKKYKGFTVYKNKGYYLIEIWQE
jgi:hypothetical protein